MVEQNIGTISWEQNIGTNRDLLSLIYICKNINPCYKLYKTHHLC
jgi:hypothetical protein